MTLKITMPVANLLSTLKLLIMILKLYKPQFLVVTAIPWVIHFDKERIKVRLKFGLLVPLHISTKKALFGLWLCLRMVERSRPAPEIRGTNSVIIIFYLTINCIKNGIEKTKKEKEAGNVPFLTKYHYVGNTAEMRPES